MRIIAGRFRRRRLASAPGTVTRPLTDRVKEQLFQRLGPFDGERVLDVFAGTGTIGLEALSRGARSVVFVERDRKAFELLRRNIETLGVEDEVFCWRTDVLRCSFRPKGREAFLPFDRVFFDPPYAIAEQIRPGTPLYRSLERLARRGVTSSGAELVLRVPARERVAIPPDWREGERIEEGGMAIHRLRRNGVSAEGAGTGGDEEVAEAMDEWEEE